MFRAGIIVRLFIPLLLGVGCSACTTIAVNDGQALQGHYVGFVSVRVPEAHQGMTAVEAKNLGVTLDRGIAVGWSLRSVVQANPADCHLMVVIRSDVEAESAAKILESLKGEKLCVVDYSGE